MSYCFEYDLIYGAGDWRECTSGRCGGAHVHVIFLAIALLHYFIAWACVGKIYPLAVWLDELHCHSSVSTLSVFATRYEVELM